MSNPAPPRSRAHPAAAGAGWIGGSRSRSLPELPGSGGGGARQHTSSLPPLPSGTEVQLALDPSASLPRQGSEEGDDPMQQTQQAQQQAQQQQQGADEAAAAAATAFAAGGAFDAGLAESFRLQQQQQQAAEAALRTSPSVDMLASSAAPSPRAPPPSAMAPSGLGMRHHASYSSLRSSVSGGRGVEQLLVFS